MGDAQASVQQAASIDPHLAPAMHRRGPGLRGHGHTDFAGFHAAAIGARGLERPREGDLAGARCLSAGTLGEVSGPSPELVRASQLNDVYSGPSRGLDRLGEAREHCVGAYPSTEE